MDTSIAESAPEAASEPATDRVIPSAAERLIASKMVDAQTTTRISGTMTQNAEEDKKNC